MKKTIKKLALTKQTLVHVTGGADQFTKIYIYSGCCPSGHCPPVTPACPQ